MKDEDSLLDAINDLHDEIEKFMRPIPATIERAFRTG